MLYNLYKTHFEAATKGYIPTENLNDGNLLQLWSSFYFKKSYICISQLRVGYGLNCVFPNSYVEVLTPKVILFEDGVVGRELALDEVIRVGSS